MLTGRKGVRTMSFSDVAVLLTLIGGTIFVTFQITWKIATSDKKRKKNDRLTVPQLERSFFLITR